MRPAAVGYQCPDDARGSRQEFHQPGRRVGTAAAGFTVTKTLIVIMVGIYVLGVAMSGVDASSLIGGATDKVLIRLGVEQPFLIAEGQYWRLFTNMFLHFGIIHLALNMYALYIIGSVIEAELGRVRFIALFLVTGWFASCVAYWLTPPLVLTNAGPIVQISAGASGAIFGLFGVFLAYNYRRRHMAFYASRLRQIVMVVVLNLVFTFSIPEISWQAHVGGLVAGLVAGYAIDGFGARVSRTVALVVTLTAVLAASAAIVMVRTAELHAAFPSRLGA